MKTFKFFFFIFPLIFLYLDAESYEVVAPNEKFKIKLNINNGTKYEILFGENQLIMPSTIGLNLSDGFVVGQGTVKNVERKSVSNIINVPIGKNKTLIEIYNELIISYNEGYDLIVRAYNEGIAYRFVTHLEGEIIVVNEDAIFNFPADTKVYFPECDTNTSMENGGNGTSYPIHQGFRNFERKYNTYTTTADITSGKFSVTPVLFEFSNELSSKIVITEADTYDYPGLYLESNGVKSMRGMWAKYPKKVLQPNNYYSNHLVYEREDYIAKTNGNRTFPWRVIIPVDDDILLLNNELVYLLAEPQRLEDISWIKPGKTSWEWWHKAMLEGVDFPVGNDNLDLQLYKYYVDFASANNIEYMTLDAGWKDSYIRQLCTYADTKNVKIFVWTWASNVLDPGREQWMSRMKNSGVYGLKIDFFERNDQIAMTWGHRLAQELADLEMVAIFHGCPVPTGLNRTFPNILNFEAVRGAECNFWDRGSSPDYHVQFPFIRQLAGPLDYTPGSMRNTNKNLFQPVDRPNIVPSSMGTRAHELAMYVIFDHWLVYLCDAPTEYAKYPEILDFLSAVPSVWDKTLPLDAKFGEYILMAKQTGEEWYVGGMSNWEAREINVDFSFLVPEKNYTATIIRDGDNASNYPKNTIHEKLIVTNETKMRFSTAKGGGFVIRLTK